MWRLMAWGINVGKDGVSFVEDEEGCENRDF